VVVTALHPYGRSPSTIVKITGKVRGEPSIAALVEPLELQYGPDNRPGSPDRLRHHERFARCADRRHAGGPADRSRPCVLPTAQKLLAVQTIGCWSPNLAAAPAAPCRPHQPRHRQPHCGRRHPDGVHGAVENTPNGWNFDGSSWRAPRARRQMRMPASLPWRRQGRFKLPVPIDSSDPAIFCSLDRGAQRGRPARGWREARHRHRHARRTARRGSTGSRLDRPQAAGVRRPIVSPTGRHRRGSTMRPQRREPIFDRGHSRSQSAAVRPSTLMSNGPSNRACPLTSQPAPPTRASGPQGACHAVAFAYGAENNTAVDRHIAALRLERQRGASTTPADACAARSAMSLQPPRLDGITGAGRQGSLPQPPKRWQVLRRVSCAQVNAKLDGTACPPMRRAGRTPRISARTARSRASTQPTPRHPATYPIRLAAPITLQRRLRCGPMRRALASIVGSMRLSRRNPARRGSPSWRWRGEPGSRSTSSLSARTSGNRHRNHDALRRRTSMVAPRPPYHAAARTGSAAVRLTCAPTPNAQCVRP